jgi:hypothetical protein
MAIDVEITGCGRVRGDDIESDPSVVARCSLCRGQVEAAASIAISPAAGPSALACADCLRARLDALSVGRFRLCDPQPGGIPWGKISG